MKNRGIRIPHILFILLFITPFCFAQNNTQIGGHRGAVTALLVDERQRILSAGTDGYVQIWNIEKNAPELRFQISPYSITSMVLRPGRSELAFVETNASGTSRISVWDYEAKQNIFTLPFSDSIGNVYYSAAGSFLVITGSAGVTLVQSENGKVLPSPQDLTGPIVFAATGRSERSMITYASSGFLWYWDLQTGQRTQSLNVPRDIKSPILLGNNRFLAGFDASGLIILDAVSGAIMFREAGITSGTLFTGNPEGLEFVCFSQGSTGTNISTLYHLTIQNFNRVEILNRKVTAENIPQISAGVVISADSAVLGTVDGQVLIFNQNGSGRFMGSQNQVGITEIAASSNALAFRTENSLLGFLPLDYSRLNSNTVIKLEDSGSYTAIASSFDNADFLLWQSANTRSFPLIKRLSNNPENGTVSEAFIDRLTLRFPLRSVSVMGNYYLFLDTVGNIRIINQRSGAVVYDNLFPGAQDAAFVNESSILIARSASSGNTAFLTVDYVTGETVHLPLAAVIGIKAYRGASGFVYGAAISRAGNQLLTSLYYVNTANPVRSYSLVELDREDSLLSIAESAPFLATTLGNSGALIYRIPGINSSASNDGSTATAMERSAGLPQKIISGGRYFICLDSDGNIAWHDPGTGKILALFRIYEDTWVLESQGRTVQGKISY